MMTRAMFAALLLISLGNSPLQAACPGGVSNFFTVSGEVTNRAVFDLNNLESFLPAQEKYNLFCRRVGCHRIIHRRASVGSPEQVTSQWHCEEL
jgi:hypothetical protein